MNESVVYYLRMPYTDTNCKSMRNNKINQFNPDLPSFEVQGIKQQIRLTFSALFRSFTSTRFLKSLLKLCRGKRWNMMAYFRIRSKYLQPMAKFSVCQKMYIWIWNVPCNYSDISFWDFFRLYSLNSNISKPQYQSIFVKIKDTLLCK